MAYAPRLLCHTNPDFYATWIASQTAWYRMENRPKSENGKKWPKNRKWPSARNGGKMAQKWRKKRKMTPISHFSPFLGHFFPISGRGPFSIFRPIFSHFRISARFPFYTRRSDSQHMNRFCWGWGGLLLSNQCCGPVAAPCCAHIGRIFPER